MARAIQRNFVMSKPYVPMSLAKARAVTHLANSAGCKLTSPKLIHDFDPLISLATKGVISSTTIITQ